MATSDLLGATWPVPANEAAKKKTEKQGLSTAISLDLPQQCNMRTRCSKAALEYRHFTFRCLILVTSMSDLI